MENLKQYSDLIVQNFTKRIGETCKNLGATSYSIENLQTNFHEGVYTFKLSKDVKPTSKILKGEFPELCALGDKDELAIYKRMNNSSEIDEINFRAFELSTNKFFKSKEPETDTISFKRENIDKLVSTDIIEKLLLLEKNKGKIFQAIITYPTQYDFNIKSEVCDSCNGKGEKKCAECSGNGKVICKRCDGYGRVRCSCRSGHNSDGSICRKCNGSGYITCSTCRGTGRQVCPECGGSGIVECFRCDGTGYITIVSSAILLGIMEVEYPKSENEALNKKFQNEFIDTESLFLPYIPEAKFEQWGTYKLSRYVPEFSFDVVCTLNGKTYKYSCHLLGTEIGRLEGFNFTKDALKLNVLKRGYEDALEAISSSSLLLPLVEPILNRTTSPQLNRFKAFFATNDEYHAVINSIRKTCETFQQDVGVEVKRVLHLSILLIILIVFALLKSANDIAMFLLLMSLTSFGYCIYWLAFPRRKYASKLGSSVIRTQVYICIVAAIISAIPLFFYFLHL